MSAEKAAGLSLGCILVCVLLAVRALFIVALLAGALWVLRYFGVLQALGIGS